MKDIVDCQDFIADYKNIIDDYETNKITAVIAELKKVVVIVKLQKTGIEYGNGNKAVVLNLFLSHKGS